MGLLMAVVVSGCGEADDHPTAIEEQNWCEAACERVYAPRSEEGCQQSFRHDDGSTMNEQGCVEACQQTDLMRGGEECIARDAECGADPVEMVDACLPDDYHPPACDHLDAWDPQVEQMEETVLDLVNDHRASGANCGTEGQFGVADPLEMNTELRCAARLHSMDMAERDFFDHQNPDGESPAERIAETGYMDSPTDRMTGENIAYGSQTAEQVVQGWMDSDGHCANIMHPQYEEIGVGKYDDYWTQKFGR